MKIINELSMDFEIKLNVNFKINSAFNTKTTYNFIQIIKQSQQVNEM